MKLAHLPKILVKQWKKKEREKKSCFMLQYILLFLLSFPCVWLNASGLKDSWLFKVTIIIKIIITKWECFLLFFKDNIFILCCNVVLSGCGQCSRRYPWCYCVVVPVLVATVLMTRSSSLPWHLSQWYTPWKLSFSMYFNEMVFGFILSIIYNFIPVSSCIGWGPSILYLL